MDSSRSGFPGSGPDDGVIWLDICPPLQPEQLGWAFGGLQEKFGPGDIPLPVDRSRDHLPRRAVGMSDDFLRPTGSGSDVADSISHRERLEMIYAGASLAISEDPSWLILAVERDAVGSALEDRRL